MTLSLVIDDSEDVENLMKLKNDCKTIKVQKGKAPVNQSQANEIKETKKINPNALIQTVEPTKFQVLQDIQSNENFSIGDEGSQETGSQTNNDSKVEEEPIEEPHEETKVEDPEKTKIEKLIMGTHKEEDADEEDIDDYLRKLEQ